MSAGDPPVARGALGFVVAGGQSQRMGSDKALLRWDAGTLLDHAIARLRPLCDQVFVLSGAERRYAHAGLEVLLDAWPAAGPLGGILAGLERLDERPGIFLAVDVPAVPIALLARMLELLAGYDAVVPLHAHGAEPLVAVYAQRCREPVRRHLAAGDRKLSCFWPDVRVRLLAHAELLPFGDPGHVFTNVNDPDDYARVTARTTISESSR
jgi:molybdenum cofactor guanylyltransferase